MSLALGETCFKKYVDLIHELTGITISSNRISMVEGRLRKRVTSLGIESYEEYLNVLKRDQTEQTCFIDFSKDLGMLIILWEYNLNCSSLFQKYSFTVIQFPVSFSKALLISLINSLRFSGFPLISHSSSLS